VKTGSEAGIQTVLGRISPGALGITDAHTHVFRDGGPIADADPDFLLDSPERAAEELSAFRAAGGGALVDMMPTAPGRDASRLAEVSRRTGVHIVAATGFVPWALYPGSAAWRLTAEELADSLAAEVLEGIDAGNGAGGEVRRLEARAGVIKVAVGSRTPTEPEMRFEQAAARAHRLTGASVSVHTERGAGAEALLERMSAWGVPPTAILIAHTSQSGDLALLLRIAAAGAWLIMDGAGKPKYSEDELIRQLHGLAEAGFAGRVLLALDFSRRSYWKSCGGRPGFEYLAREFAARLAGSGLPAATVREMLAGNAARAFTMRHYGP